VLAGVDAAPIHRDLDRAMAIADTECLSPYARFEDRLQPAPELATDEWLERGVARKPQIRAFVRDLVLPLVAFEELRAPDRLDSLDKPIPDSPHARRKPFLRSFCLSVS
jgi:hypothetical protein